MAGPSSKQLMKRVTVWPRSARAPYHKQYQYRRVHVYISLPPLNKPFIIIWSIIIYYHLLSNFVSSHPFLNQQAEEPQPTVTGELRCSHQCLREAFGVGGLFGVASRRQGGRGSDAGLATCQGCGCAMDLRWWHDLFLLTQYQWCSMFKTELVFVRFV